MADNTRTLDLPSSPGDMGGPDRLLVTSPGNSFGEYLTDTIYGESVGKLTFYIVQFHFLYLNNIRFFFEDSREA